MITTETHMDAAVELRDVVREYGSKQACVRALDGVDIGFARGTWTAVMGPSGSGKSTLLHCAAGLERPTSGQVLLGDRELTAASERELTALRRKEIGFVFQNFNLVGSLTAEQNVALPLRLTGRKVSTKEVRAILSEVGLGERLRHRPRELSGGSRGQVRRLLLSEALLLGALGTVLGVPVGLIAMRAQTSLLASLGFLPDSFSAEWHGWILYVSAGIGIGVAQLGVLSASRRASRVRPLEALRETGAAAKVMTFSRWFFGILLLAVAITLMSISTAVDSPNGAIPLSINSTLALALGLSALSPVIVPLVGRVTGSLAGTTTLGRLARANLRDGVRRNASTAAPLLILVALLIGLAGTFDTLSAGAQRQLAEDVHGDLVAAGPVAPGTPGVASASAEYTLLIEVTTVSYDDEETDDVEALAIDPAAYQQVHRQPLIAGSFADLHGLAVAVAGGDLGSTVRIRVGGREITPRVVAVLPPKLNGGPEYLLPRDLVPPAVLGPVRSIVQLQPGADANAVAATLPQPVSTVDEWIAESDSAQDTLNAGVMKVVMGLAALYALIAVVNAIVIAAGDRRREFAVARLTGFSRGQMIATALLESSVVTVTGLGLGCLAALGTLIGISGVAGTMVAPWGIFWPTVLGAFLVVGATSVWTSLTTTRPTPISLAGARE